MNHFLDIGANVGQTFDCYLSKTNEYDGWTVWCFEPSPRHLPGLMEKIRSVKDRFKVNLCTFGIFSRSGLFPIYEKQDVQADTLYGFLGRENTNEFGIFCHTISIVDFLSQNTAPEDTVVLKLDCEGSEYEIIASLAWHPCLNRVKKIMVEWHNLIGFDRQPLIDEYKKKGVELEIWPF